MRLPNIVPNIVPCLFPCLLLTLGLAACEEPQSCGGGDEAGCSNEGGTDSGTDDDGTTTDDGTTETTDASTDSSDTSDPACEPAQDATPADVGMQLAVVNGTNEPIFLAHTTFDECLAITPMLITSGGTQVQWTTQGPNVSVGGECATMTEPCGFGCENSAPPYYTRIEPGVAAQYIWDGYWWELVDVPGSCLGCAFESALCNAGRQASEGEMFDIVAAVNTGCEDNVDFNCACPNNESVCQIQGEFNFTGPSAESVMQFSYTDGGNFEILFE